MSIAKPDGRNVIRKLDSGPPPVERTTQALLRNSFITENVERKIRKPRLFNKLLMERLDVNGMTLDDLRLSLRFC
jgi:hypothetical protein